MNPPHIPTLRKRIVRELKEAFFVAETAITVIRNAPRTLMNNVVTGKPFSGFIGTSPNKKRLIAPNAPPAPTATQSRINENI